MNRIKLYEEGIWETNPSMVDMKMIRLVALIYYYRYSIMHDYCIIHCLISFLFNLTSCSLMEILIDTNESEKTIYNLLNSDT